MQRSLVPAWLLRVPPPFQITELSKEVFSLKESLKAQQAAPASSEEEEALRGQVVALQERMEVPLCGRGGVKAATRGAVAVQMGVAGRIQAGQGTSGAYPWLGHQQPVDMGF